MHMFTKGLAGLAVVVVTGAGMASAASAQPAGFTVKPVSGRTTTGDQLGQWVGGGTDAKAYANGNGSYTLTKNVSLETWAFAALDIGVEGKTLDGLGTLTYTVDELTNGSPRVNLSYTDETTDGPDFKFLGGLAAADANGVVTIDLEAVSNDAEAEVLSLAIIRDEPGTSTVSNIDFSGLS